MPEKAKGDKDTLRNSVTRQGGKQRAAGELAAMLPFEP